MPRRKELSPEERSVLERFSAPAGWWVALGVLVLVLLSIEIPLVLLSDNLDRVMAGHGGVVIVGGLAWAVFMTLLILYPVKRMTVWMLVLYERFVERNEKTASRLEDLAERGQHTLNRVQNLLDQLDAENMLETLQKIEKGICEIRNVAVRDTTPLVAKGTRMRGAAPQSTVAVPESASLATGDKERQ